MVTGSGGLNGGDILKWLPWPSHAALPSLFKGALEKKMFYSLSVHSFNMPALLDIITSAHETIEGAFDNL